MGRRGPAAKGEFGDKSAVLSTRISAELRAALEKSVAESGLTLSREIEHRLRRSFDDDRMASEGFGTRRNRALMKMIALSMQTAWHPDKPDAEWLDDLWLFHQTIARIVHILMAVRPAGDLNPPTNEKVRHQLEQVDPMERAGDIWHFIQRADSSLPLTEKDPSYRLFNRLKADLGEVAHRPEIVEGTAETAAESSRAVVREIEKFSKRSKWQPKPSKRKTK